MYDPTDMSKKSPGADTRYRIDDPTAAFPIGALAGIAERLDREEELDEVEPDEVLDDDGDTFGGPGRIHPAFLVLSLLGGGVLAMGIIAIVALFLLMS